MFESPATLYDGITQELPDEQMLFEGSMVDISSIKPFSSEEQDEYQRLVSEAKGIKQPESKQKSDTFLKSTGLSQVSITQLQRDVLPLDFPLSFDNHGVVLVKDLDESHNFETLACPMDQKQRANKGICYWNNGKACIYSIRTNTSYRVEQDILDFRTPISDTR